MYFLDSEIIWSVTIAITYLPHVAMPLLDKSLKDLATPGRLILKTILNKWWLCHLILVIDTFILVGNYNSCIDICQYQHSLLHGYMAS